MNVGNGTYPSGLCGRNGHRWFLAVFVALVCAFVWIGAAFAAESIPKYQVVSGGEDKAYLLNTATGYVWVLTYRTTATGREPIAIPYKFIKVCPSDQKNFLVEDAKDAACMPGR